MFKVFKSSSLLRKRNTSKTSVRLLLSFVVILLTTAPITAQELEIKNKRYQRVGLNLGYAQQDRFPFNDEDYSHITRSIKIQLAQELWKKNNNTLEILIEPSIYFVNHRLKNLFFIKPSAPNFEEQRELFTQNRSYNEYALNIGISYNYTVFNHLVVYGLLSVGPMTATADTERQRKGFSFSDILGIGTRYQINKMHLDLRFTLRHVSNANLRTPNNGHNTAGIEVGFSHTL